MDQASQSPDLNPIKNLWLDIIDSFTIPMKIDRAGAVLQRILWKNCNVEICKADRELYAKT